MTFGLKIPLSLWKVYPKLLKLDPKLYVLLNEFCNHRLHTARTENNPGIIQGVVMIMTPVCTIPFLWNVDSDLNIPHKTYILKIFAVNGAHFDQSSSDFTVRTVLCIFHLNRHYSRCVSQTKIPPSLMGHQANLYFLMRDEPYFHIGWAMPQKSKLMIPKT